MQPPVFLLRWLPPGEASEVWRALAKFAQKLGITYADVYRTEDAKTVITQWLSGNCNTQYLYIGSHGNEGGVGADATHFVNWAELRSWLEVSPVHLKLWLGACKSSHAASGIPVQPLKSCRVDAIWGFEGKVKTGAIERVLLKLLELTQRADVGDAEEFAAIRQLDPPVQTKAYYLGVPKKGDYAYVDGDDFEVVTGFPLGTRR